MHCHQEKVKIVLPLKMVAIDLPDWGKKFGVNGHMLVPQECVGSEKDRWEQVDWWLAMFLLLEGWHERLWEQKHGTIHSYSFRLKGWDSRAWDHAWVNRIALFLKRWFCKDFKKEDEFFGTPPKSKILLSHDVDAVCKTLPIRMKQSAFIFFNSGRSLVRGEIPSGVRYLSKGIKFFLSNENWWIFDKLLDLEQENKIKAVYNFYADSRPKSFRRWLMDPSYNVSTENLKELFVKLRSKGHEIGIHPTYDCWQDTKLLEKQKNLLEENAEIKITKCRQHWLRFSWEKTWQTQSEAGIKEDSTLMFNDRPGFRNSSCITWKPWCTNYNKPSDVLSTGSVLMDSHLYDYENLDFSSRTKIIRRWTREINETLGECYLLWHPQTLTKDYGWSDGFKMILKTIAEK